MNASRQAIADRKPTARARQTNRPLEIVGADGRTKWARRRRDLLAGLLSELEREPTTRDRALANNTVSVLLRCEQIGAQIARGEATSDRELVRLSHIAQRMLNALRAESTRPQAQPGTGGLAAYLAQKRGSS
jgi:hypothetical protein